MSTGTRPPQRRLPILRARPRGANLLRRTAEPPVRQRSAISCTSQSQRPGQQIKQRPSPHDLSTHQLTLRSRIDDGDSTSGHLALRQPHSYPSRACYAADGLSQPSWPHTSPPTGTIRTPTTSTSAATSPPPPCRATTKTTPLTRSPRAPSTRLPLPSHTRLAMPVLRVA